MYRWYSAEFASSLTESGVEGSELDVGVNDCGISLFALKIRGNTRRSLATATASAQVTVGVLVGGVSGVEPEHVGVVVIPQRHDEHHALSKSLGHISLATLVLVSVSVLESCLLLVTELGCDGVAVDAGNRGSGLCNGLSALDVEALDLHSVASADELSDDGELLRGIDGHTLAVEVLDTHAVGVEVTAIRVADASIAVGGVCSTTAVTIAARLLDRAAGMGCHRRADGVGLPDIHLGAARTMATDTCVCVVRRRLPAFNVTLGGGSVIITTTWLRLFYLAVDELQIPRALGIAIPSTVLGASLVAGVLLHTAVRIHRYEVKRAVETARQFRYIDVEGELMVAGELEHLVLGVRSHEIRSRTDVGRVRALSNEFQRQRVAASCDSIGALVVCSIDGAVGRTRLVVGARGSVPLIASVAVGVSNEASVTSSKSPYSNTYPPLT
jgi:hypothetical protein